MNELILHSPGKNPPRDILTGAQTHEQAKRTPRGPWPDRSRETAAAPRGLTQPGRARGLPRGGVSSAES